MFTGIENCWHCGEPGHIKSACPKLSASRCAKCNKAGHDAKQCGTRKRGGDASVEQGKRRKATVSCFSRASLCSDCVLHAIVMCFACLCSAISAVKSDTRPTNVAPAMSLELRRCLILVSMCRLSRFWRALKRTRTLRAVVRSFFDSLQEGPTNGMSLRQARSNHKPNVKRRRLANLRVSSSCTIIVLTVL